MAKLIIGVDVAGVRALAGPITGAAVLYDATTVEPVFEVADRRGIKRRYTLREPKKIPQELLPHVVAYIKRTALSFAFAQRPAATMTSTKVTSWEAMGQAAARAAERASHLHRQACQVGKDELEIYIPAGGHCPYKLVGRIGQRLAPVDWHRGAAFVLARAAHYDAIRALHERFPQYDFTTNLGYTSTTHQKALRRFGRTPEHRG